ncbi:hypothetical protein [Clostridium sp. K25]|uniref:hypothetical protein n=1 Tax=Clostridium sp. K25 TaxID=1443109 RepID=UPI000A5B4754|nr:hypothetical protein [Clostridium sp. K25]
MIKKYEGCRYCCCSNCPNKCKNCKNCNKGLDGYGYCKTYIEIEDEEQLSLFNCVNSQK